MLTIHEINAYTLDIYTLNHTLDKVFNQKPLDY